MTRLGQSHPRLSPSRACVPRSLPAGMQGVWHWAKGPLFPGQGVRQGSRALEGGRGGGATGAARRRQRLRQVPAGVSPPPPWRHSPRPAPAWDPRWLPAARARTLHATPRSSRPGPGAAGVLLGVPVRGPGSASACWGGGGGRRSSCSEQARPVPRPSAWPRPYSSAHHMAPPKPRLQQSFLPPRRPAPYSDPAPSHYSHSTWLRPSPASRGTYQHPDAPPYVHACASPTESGPNSHFCSYSLRP